MKRLSKVLFVVLLATFVLVGCKTAEKIPVPVEPGYKVSVLGYETRIEQTASDELVVRYPDVFTVEDIVGFATVLAEQYPLYLNDTTASIDETAHTMTVKFPYEFTDEELAALVPEFEKALTAYTNLMVQMQAEAKAAAQRAAEEQKAIDELLKAAEERSYSTEIITSDFKLKVDRLASDTVLVTYPAVFSNEEVKAVASYAVEAFGAALDGSEMVLLGDGQVIIKLAYDFTNEEIEQVAPAVGQGIDEFVKMYVAKLAQDEKAAEEARVKAAAAAEAAKAAAEAAAKAAEAAKEAAAKAAAEKAAQEAAAKAAEAQAAAQAAQKAPKKSGVGTVILIIVIVLLAAACAYYFLIFRKKGTK